MNFTYIEPSELHKAIKLANDIYSLRDKHRPNDYRGFIDNGSGNSRDSSHRLRLIHDEFLQDSFKNDCIGTIYRSEGMLKETCPRRQIHCEHVIPNNLLAKYIFYNLNDSDIYEFYDFIYFNRVICGVHNNEKPLLNCERAINNKKSRWVSSHPNFENKQAKFKSVGQLKQVKPFYRYINTELEDKIYCIASGKAELIDHEIFTMEKHYEITKIYQKGVRIKFDKAIEQNRYMG